MLCALLLNCDGILFMQILARLECSIRLVSWSFDIVSNINCRRSRLDASNSESRHGSWSNSRPGPRSKVSLRLGATTNWLDGGKVGRTAQGHWGTSTNSWSSKDTRDHSASQGLTGKSGKAVESRVHWTNYSLADWWTQSSLSALLQTEISVLEEVSEVISMPEWTAGMNKNASVNPESIKLSPDVMWQLNDYVTSISTLYRYGKVARSFCRISNLYLTSF